MNEQTPEQSNTAQAPEREWHRQMVRIPESTPSHDQHIRVHPAWSSLGGFEVEMSNANAGTQSIRLSKEDLVSLAEWIGVS